MIDDTGYSALQLPTDDFLNKLIIIKNQMKMKNHPLTQFIICFDMEFFQDFNETDADTALRHIYNVLHLLMISVIKFYNLDLMGQELWKDLLLNLLTNMVLRNQVYIIYYNLIVKSLINYEDQDKSSITVITKNVQMLQGVFPQQFGVNDIHGRTKSLRFILWKR